jgi:hypothetical protein
MAKMFLKLTKDIMPQKQDIFQIISRINTEKPSPGLITVKLLRAREGSNRTTAS